MIIQNSFKMAAILAKPLGDIMILLHLIAISAGKIARFAPPSKVVKNALKIIIYSMQEENA